jgi:hypothetical protein
MKRWQRILAGILAALVLVGGITWAVQAIRHRVRYGQTFDESALHPAVAVGDRFSLAIPDRGASVGDQWAATVTPANAVTDEGSTQELSSLTERIFGAQDGGGAGTRYFTYTADRPGAVTVATASSHRATVASSEPAAAVSQLRARADCSAVGSGSGRSAA